MHKSIFPKREYLFDPLDHPSPVILFVRHLDASWHHYTSAIPFLDQHRCLGTLRHWDSVLAYRQVG